LLNQWPPLASDHAMLQALAKSLNDRLMALTNGDACVYELATKLDAYTTSQAWWNRQLNYLKANNGTSADLKNWVNSTTFLDDSGNPILDAAGNPIIFRVP